MRKADSSCHAVCRAQSPERAVAFPVGRRHGIGQRGRVRLVGLEPGAGMGDMGAHPLRRGALAQRIGFARKNGLGCGQGTNGRQGGAVYFRLRKRVFEVFAPDQPRDPLSRGFDIALMLLIALNVLAVVLETVPSLTAAWGNQFAIFETASLIVFTVEYCLRVWSCVERADRPYGHPLWGRLRFMASPAAILDLLAVLPFLLAPLLGLDLRFLKIFRLVRIFKLTRYSNAVHILTKAVRAEADIIAASLFLMAVIAVASAAVMYMVENEAQPDAFPHLPAAIYYAVTTLTTVGYGDIVPVTPIGRAISGLMGVIGLAMIAIPSGILASAFSEQLRRQREAFTREVEEAVEAGDVRAEDAATQPERALSTLDRMRRELGLSEEDAAEILTAVAADSNPRACPHCGMPLVTHGRNPDDAAVDLPPETADGDLFPIDPQDPDAAPDGPETDASEFENPETGTKA